MTSRAARLCSATVALISASSSPGLPFAVTGVELVLPDGSVFPRKGRLNYLASQIDPTLGTQQFRAEFDNGDGHGSVRSLGAFAVIEGIWVKTETFGGILA